MLARAAREQMGLRLAEAAGAKADPPSLAWSLRELRRGRRDQG
jgi:hypothetical protein